MGIGGGCASFVEALAEDGAITILGRWGAALSHRSAASLWGLLAHREWANRCLDSRRWGPEEATGHSRASVSLALTCRCDASRRNPGHDSWRGRSQICAVPPPKRTGRGASRTRNCDARSARPEVLGLPIGPEARSRTALAATSSATSCGSAAAIACRPRRSTFASARTWSTSSGATASWSSRPTATAITADASAFEDDRARDLELRARGFEVIRLAEKQVAEEAGRVAEILAARSEIARSEVVG